MCLIIAPGKDGKPALLPRDVFDYTYKRNNDGFGAMWIEDGRVQHFKTVGLTADEIYSQMEERVARNPETIFHMRLKTHGKIITGLSHPFRILNKNRHGKDLFMMHNGVLGSYGNNLSYGQSDTTVFKDKILIPLLTRDPDALDDPEVWEAIEKLTGGSRLAFMDSDGKTYFSSPASWNENYGLTLSNTYMIPSEYERSHTTTGFHTPVNANSLVLTGPEVMTVTSHNIYFRTIDRAGVVNGCWCSCPKLGFVRTEAGNLYRDNGPDNKIYHAANFIPKDNEFRYLGLSIVPSSTNIDSTVIDQDVGSSVMDQDLDDDVPFDYSHSVDRSEAGSPATYDKQLRYARIVHNTYGSKVASRIHLIADLIGMSDDEMSSFVSEDPETTTVVLAELVEIILHYNQTLWTADPNHPEILDADEVLRIGQADYHRDAIKEIAKVRRAEYEDQVKRLLEAGDVVPEEGEVNVA